MISAEHVYLAERTYLLWLDVDLQGNARLDKTNLKKMYSSLIQTRAYTFRNKGSSGVFHQSTYNKPDPIGLFTLKTPKGFFTA
jgi:hypothetical protein